jgi:tetratricopeptide (TPR) repeat protein
MYCSNASCGIQLPPAIKICPQCGNRGFSATPPPAPAMPAMRAPGPAQRTPPKAKYCQTCGNEVPATVLICPVDSNRTFSDAPPRLSPPPALTASGAAAQGLATAAMRRARSWYRPRLVQAAFGLALIAAVASAVLGWQRWQRQQREDEAQTAWAAGNKAFVEDKAEQAVASYSDAIRLWPDFAQAYVSRGSAELVLLKYDEAKGDFDEAIRRKPDYPEAYYARGVYFWYRGDLSAAEQDFRRLVALRPENDTYAKWFARVMYAQKSEAKTAEIKSFYRRLYEEKHSREWALEGWLGALAGNDANLAEECQKLEAAGVRSAMMEYFHGEALYNLRRYSEAIAHLKRAAEGDVTKIPTDVLVLLAKAQLSADSSLNGRQACYESIRSYSDRMGRSERASDWQKRICG